MVCHPIWNDISPSDGKLFLLGNGLRIFSGKLVCYSMWKDISTHVHLHQCFEELCGLIILILMSSYRWIVVSWSSEHSSLERNCKMLTNICSILAMGLYLWFVLHKVGYCKIGYGSGDYTYRQCLTMLLVDIWSIVNLLAYGEKGGSFRC